MGMTWQKLLSLTLSAALVIASAPVQAVEIQIKRDTMFRQIHNGQALIGTLKAGSIVDIELANNDRQNDVDGYFDLHRTLQYIAQNPQPGQVSNRFAAGQTTTLYKVKITFKAPGSTAIDGASNTMVPLADLERHGQTYYDNGRSVEVTTNADTAVYAAASASNTGTEAADCPTCNAPEASNTPVATSTADVLAAIAAQAGSSDVAVDPKDDDAAPSSSRSTRGLQGFPRIGSCNRFIDTDGSLGDYGRMAQTEIQSHPAFQNNSTPFTSICRNYRDFSAEQKEHFQIWVLASLSAHEAGGCQAGAKNPQAYHGQADGLLQMEDSLRLRGSRSYYHPYCEGSMFSARNNLRCGIEIMNVGLVSSNLSLYAQNTGHQYWADLRNHGLSQDLINQYSACGNQQTHYAGQRSFRGSASRKHSSTSRRHHARRFKRKTTS